MRINVYSEELTSEVMLVTKHGTNENGDTETFNGVRMILVSSDVLHNTPKDDDRPAVTFWLPKSSTRRQELANALYQMASLVDNTV